MRICLVFLRICNFVISFGIATLLLPPSPQFLDASFWSVCGVFSDFFFSLHFGLGSFYLLISKLTDSFFGCVESTNEPIKTSFISVPVLFIHSITFWFFLRIFISLMTLPICSCMLSIASTKALNILITVVLNFLPDNFNTCVMSHIWVWFWCLLCLLSLCFFLPLGMPKVSNASSILDSVSFLYVCVSLSSIPQNESGHASSLLLLYWSPNSMQWDMGK